MLPLRPGVMRISAALSSVRGSQTQCPAVITVSGPANQPVP